jgi:fructose PTS system EIIB component
MVSSMGGDRMKVVAVTACPTGIAHTYMAAEALKKAALQLKLAIKIETQGALGIDNPLSERDIAQASVVIIAADVGIEREERFAHRPVTRVSMQSVLTDATAVLRQVQMNAQA